MWCEARKRWESINNVDMWTMPETSGTASFDVLSVDAEFEVLKPMSM